MSSYGEMKSRGSYNEVTRGKSKTELADEALRRDREAEAKRQRAMAWVRKEAPWLPDGWVGIYAGKAITLHHRTGRHPSINDITEYLRGARPWPNGNPAWAVDDPEIGIKSKEAA